MAPSIGKEEIMKKLTILAAVLALTGIIAGRQAIGDKPFGLSPTHATAWRDLGIVYGAGPEKAYYPSVLYDRRGFGDRHGPKYKMWYSDGAGTVTVVTSSDDRSWSDPTVNEGLVRRAHHVQVVYDPNCFGATPCDSSEAKYKIWYWDMDAQLYSICAMATAKSIDGVYWTDETTLTQSETSPLVTGDCSTGGGTGWNRGSYGPIDVIYQPGAPNTGDDPWDYSYVMFYDGTNGDNEETGLAYSTDGKDWTAYVENPVLGKGPEGAWDDNDAAYGTVLWDANGFHFWYSGGGPASEGGVHAGIGYAFSLDGLTWTKAPNPIFHITDEGASHRDERTYTPSVVDVGRGKLKMYYSAKSADGDYAIGLAVLKHRRDRDSDD